MPLTDTAVGALRPKESSYKIFDGGGLYIEVAPSGSRIWRVKYRFEGREKRLTVGKYLVVTLKEARLKLAEAKEVLAAGGDPSAMKRRDFVSDSTFEAGQTHLKKVINWRHESSP